MLAEAPSFLGQKPRTVAHTAGTASGTGILAVLGPLTLHILWGNPEGPRQRRACVAQETLRSGSPSLSQHACPLCPQGDSTSYRRLISANDIETHPETADRAWRSRDRGPRPTASPHSLPPRPHAFLAKLNSSHKSAMPSALSIRPTGPETKSVSSVSQHIQLRLLLPGPQVALSRAPSATAASSACVPQMPLGLTSQARLLSI